MTKMGKLIVCEINTNEAIRTWHTTYGMMIDGSICNNVNYACGKVDAGEWGGSQASPENSPIAFALANALGQVTGIKEASISKNEVQVTIEDTFEWKKDKIANQVLLAILHHLYGINSRVTIAQHSSNKKAINQRNHPIRGLYLDF
jgi:hypothetical protein